RVEKFSEIRNKTNLWSRMVEYAIGAHLINSSYSSGCEVYYWREGNNEVDFVLEYRRKVVGIEVKSGRIQHTSGLQLFQKTYKPDRLLIVGDDSLPWQDFLQMEVTSLF